MDDLMCDLVVHIEILVVHIKQSWNSIWEM